LHGGKLGLAGLQAAAKLRKKCSGRRPVAAHWGRVSGGRWAARARTNTQTDTQGSPEGTGECGASNEADLLHLCRQGLRLTAIARQGSQRFGQRRIGRLLPPCRRRQRLRLLAPRMHVARLALQQLLLLF